MQIFWIPEIKNPASILSKIESVISGIADSIQKKRMLGVRWKPVQHTLINIWKDEDLVDPVIEEEFDPDRTILTLSLEKKRAIKPESTFPSSTSQKTKKTLEHQQKIVEFLKDNGRSKCSDIAAFLNLSEARTRAILANMPNIDILGSNRNRTYRIKWPYSLIACFPYKR